jgi:hypothetical protein
MLMSDRGTESTASLQRGFRLTGLTVSELWIAAWGIGGEFHRSDIEDITAGERPATPSEHNILAAALNDYFTEHDQNHPVAAWQDLRSPR